MLKVNCASASDNPSATFTSGITGKNRWTASGVMRATRPRATVKFRLGGSGFNSVLDIRCGYISKREQKATLENQRLLIVLCLTLIESPTSASASRASRGASPSWMVSGQFHDCGTPAGNGEAREWYFDKPWNAPERIVEVACLQKHHEAVSHGNASTICCANHSAVGCRVTANQSDRRRRDR